MGNIRVLVLDVLKPHRPSVVELALRLSELENVDGADVTVVEVEKDVENIKITIRGKDISFERVEQIIQENGSAIHGVDKVTCGSKIIEEAPTPQDQK